MFLLLELTIIGAAPFQCVEEVGILIRVGFYQCRVGQYNLEALDV
jgi:hypothetical protein